MVPIFYAQKKHQTSEEDSLRLEAYILMISLCQLLTIHPCLFFEKIINSS